MTDFRITITLTRDELDMVAGSVILNVCRWTDKIHATDSDILKEIRREIRQNHRDLYYGKLKPLAEKWA